MKSRFSVRLFIISLIIFLRELLIYLIVNTSTWKITCAGYFYMIIVRDGVVLYLIYNHPSMNIIITGIQIKEISLSLSVSLLVNSYMYPTYKATVRIYR